MLENKDLAALRALMKNGGGGSGGDDWIVGDGKTRFHINIPTDARMDIRLHLAKNTADAIQIDWGDGTVEIDDNDSTTVQKLYHYKQPGDYIITCHVLDGGKLFLGYNSKVFADGTNTNPGRDFSLKKIEFGNNIKLYQNCFNGCTGLTHVKLPDGFTYIPAGTFRDCKSLREINIPDSITNIDQYAFYYCLQLTKVKIPDGVKEITPYAFQGCSYIVNLEIPYGVTSIGTYAFSSCAVIEKINFPTSVTNIEGSAFSYCRGLLCCDFSNHTSIPTLGTNVFVNHNANLQIRVPAALVDEWKAATNWAEYADNIVGV
jgi:hypothetical protein